MTTLFLLARGLLKQLQFESVDIPVRSIEMTAKGCSNRVNAMLQQKKESVGPLKGPQSSGKEDDPGGRHPHHCSFLCSPPTHPYPPPYRS